MSDGLRIEFERTDRRYIPGEVVRGRVVVSADHGDRCKAVTLVRRWRTHGMGNTARGNELELDLHTGPLEGDGPWELPFEVATPKGPITYHGTYLNVDHYVAAAIDIPWAFDPKVEEEFLLVPGDEPPSPPDALVEKVGPAAEAGKAGCGKAMGLLFALVGLVTLPLGIIFIAVGVLLMFPKLFRRIATRKVGDVGAEVEPRRVGPGGTVRVRVKIEPPRDARINEVTATLKGRERCISGSGTDRTTHTHVLHDMPTVLSGPLALPAGVAREIEAELVVPEDAPWSFAASDNAVLWEVVVHVDIPSWPDWKETIPLLVWPGAEDAPAALGDGDVEETRKALGVAVDEVGVEEDVGVEDEIEEEVPAPVASGIADETEETSDESSTTIVPDETPAETSTTVIAAEPTPEAAPPPEPVREESAAPAGEPSGLAAAVRAILAEPSYGGNRDALVSGLMESSRDFEITVERVERSFGTWDDPGLRDGRTVVGTVGDTDVPVVVRFPADLNDRIQTWKRGDRYPVRGTVAEWDRLHQRPVMHATE